MFPQRLELNTVILADAMSFPQVVQRNLFPDEIGLPRSSAPRTDNLHNKPCS
jgi:hypothetical protein